MEPISEVPCETRNLIDLREGAQTVKAHAYINEGHSQLDFTCLSKIYSNQLLSDVILVVGDREIPAHKLILALGSSYFYWKFSKDRNMKVSDRIEIDNVSYESLSTIVCYLYNSKILITEENIEDLLASADIFVLRDLKKACFDFLKDNISPKFCIRIVNIAKNFRFQELIEMAKNYIVAHFSDVIAHKDYLEMTYDELMDLISHEALIPTEVLECVISWVKHDLQKRKDSVYSLVKHIRCLSISTMYILERLIQEQWFVSNPSFYSVLGKILASYVLEAQTPFSVKPIQSKCLVVAGFPEENFISIELYDMQRNIWLDWPEGLRINSHGFEALAILESKIYYITAQEMRSLDMRNKLIWSDCSNLLDLRRDTSMIVMNNSVYVIGGKSEHCDLISAERFDTVSSEGKRIANMIEAQHSVGLGVFNGTLFAVGGKSYSGIVHNKVQCYTPDTNIWYNMPSMSFSRCESGVAVLEDKLYVVGGLKDQGSCNQVEMFDPAESYWKRLPDMHIAREAPGVIAVHSQLYVIGGYNSDLGPLNSIEVYNPTSNTWTLLTSPMKIGKYYISASLINKEDINFVTT